MANWTVRRVWRNLANLLLVLFVFIFSYGFEQFWGVLVSAITFLPRIWVHFFLVIEAWSLVASTSIMHVLLFCGVTGPILFFLLRNHPLALSILSHFVWLVVFTWFVPTLYSFFPKTVLFVAVTTMFVAVFGIFQRSHSASENVKVKSVKIKKTLKKRLRKSSQIVSFLFVGCLSLFLLNYLVVIGIWILLFWKLNDIVGYLINKFKLSKTVTDVMFPPFLGVLYALYKKGDDGVKKYFLGNVDTLATLFTVLFFLVVVVTVPSYVSFQIYYEGKDVGKRVQTMWSSNDYIPSTVKESFSSFIVRGIDYAEQRIYNATGLNVSSFNISQFQNFVISNATFSVRELLHSSGDIESIVRNNLSLLKSVRDNGKLLVNSASSVIYFILSTTTSMLFGIAVLVTVLFYLLAASTKQRYGPLSWISVPFAADANLVGAIEDIFHSTVMLALFHALFTWASFTLLRARWIYISTVLSFVFSLLPFFGAYWIAIPAAIDLYYDRSNIGPSFALAASHLMVYWMVDPLIYSEVPEVHPYVTSLSVIGGLYLMGIEGILLGPYFLIVVVVLTRWVRKNSMYSKKEVPASPGTPSTIENQKKKKRD